MGAAVLDYRVAVRFRKKPIDESTRCRPAELADGVRRHNHRDVAERDMLTTASKLLSRRAESAGVFREIES